MTGESGAAGSVAPHPAFAYIAEFAPDAIVDLRFHNGRNFVGTRIDGYIAARPMMVRGAAEAIGRAGGAFRERGYGIKIFDSYRPQPAVDHFHRWVSWPDDPESKKIYYPRLDKKDLITLDYIADRSEHSRGSAIDMTIVDLGTGDELDMGGPYLLFDVLSHLDATEITARQQTNRDFLREVMEANGFAPYAKEWWHFHFINEPFPDTYFEFPVQ